MIPSSGGRRWSSFDPGKALVLLVRGMIVVDLVAVVLACHVRLVNDAIEEPYPDVSFYSPSPASQESDRCKPVEAVELVLP